MRTVTRDFNAVDEERNFRSVPCERLAGNALRPELIRHQRSPGRSTARLFFILFCTSFATSNAPAGYTFSWSTGSAPHNTEYMLTVTVGFSSEGQNGAIVHLYRQDSLVGGTYVQPNSSSPAGSWFKDNGPANISYRAEANDYAGDYDSSSRMVTIGAPIPTTFSFGGTPFIYDGGTKTLSITPNPSNATFSKTGDSAINAGTYTATASATGRWTGSGSQQWTINKGNQSTVTISPNASSLSVPGGSVSFSASGGSGTGAYVWGGSASGGGSSVSVPFLSNGTYVVTVSRNGDGNYNASNTASATIQVGSAGPVATTFVFGNLSHTYDGSTKTATVGATPSNATITADLTKGPSVGSYTVSASAYGGFGGSGTATLSITPQVTTFSLNRTSFTYNGHSQGPSVTTSPAAASTSVTTGGELSAVNVGNYTATASVSGNYSGSNSSLKWSIKPATASFSLNQTSFTYNGSSQGPSVVISPAAASGSTSTGGTLSATNVGTYTATASSSGNYSGSTNSLFWSIDPADQPDVAISPRSQTVGPGASITFSASGGGVGGYTWGGAASGSGASKIVTFNTPGAHYVTLRSPGDNNHAASNTDSVTITVSLAPVITSSTRITATKNTALGYTITATNSPTHFAAGPMPPGLTFNSATGMISGTPSHTGSFELVLRASNSHGFDEKTLSIGVWEPIDPFVNFPLLAPIQAQINEIISVGGIVTDNNEDIRTVTARWKGSVAQQWTGLEGNFVLRSTNVFTGTVEGSHVFAMEAIDSRYIGGGNGSPGFHRRESAIRIVSPNEAPRAQSASATVISPSRIDLFGNASDSDGNLAYLRFYISYPPDYNGYYLVGSATIGGSSAGGAYSWNPPSSLTGGTYHLWVRAQDGQGAIDSNGGASATFFVGPATPSVSVDLPEVPIGDPIPVSYQHAPSASSLIGLYRYFDADSSPIVTTVVPQAGSGTLTLSSSGLSGNGFNIRLFAGANTSERLAVSNSFVLSENLTLTVLNGTGGGTGLKSGVSRTITAHPPPAGQIFSGWTHLNGPGRIGDSRATPTTFTLEGGHATVQANFSQLAAPVILVQPLSHVRTEDQSVFFEVVASGAPPPVFQWRKNGIDIPGATLPHFRLNSVQPADAGTYTVLVGNTQGQIVSDAASLTVEPRVPSLAAAIGVSPTWSPSGTTRVAWYTAGATSARVTGPGVNSTLMNGDITLTDLAAGLHTYTLVATGPSGTLERTATFAVVTPAVGPQLPSGSEMVGTLDGALAVDNRGAANYTIPLQVGPDRTGLRPQLALNYNSGSGNGVLGVGWSFSTGFPQAITRGRSIRARDGVVEGVSFINDKDKLYLDGKRLIAVAGTYGRPGSAYRTEVDSFITITATGSSGNIETFVATDKEGRKFTFGKTMATSDGYQTAAGAWQTLAYSYALKRVEDTTGHYVDLTYVDFGSASGTRFGEYVLSEIAYYNGSDFPGRVKFYYNTNEVGGSYERFDRYATYLAGNQFAHSRRLDGIDVEFGEIRVGYYAFDYGYAPKNGRLRLESVTPYLLKPTGDGFVSLRPTSFGWTDEADTNNVVQNQAGLGGADGYYRMRQYAFGDFNGDGKTDRISAVAGLPVELATSAGFTGSASGDWRPPAITIPEPYLRKVILGDFNGDGKQDVIYGNNSFMRLFAVRATDIGFAAMDGSSSPTPVVDTTDIFKDPGAITDNQQARDREGASLADRITVGDFDGDGRDDVLLYAFDGYLYFVRSTGTGFAEPIKSNIKGRGWEARSLFDWHLSYVYNSYPPENYTIQGIPCEMNGDGMIDYAAVVTVRASPLTSTIDYQIERYLEIWISKGDGNFTYKESEDYQKGVAPVYGKMEWLKVLYGVMPVDVNVDGLTDFMVLGSNPIDAGDLTRRPIDHRRWTLFLNRGAPPGHNLPIFERIVGVVPNTVTVNGESINTFYSSFSALANNDFLPWVDSGNTAMLQLRAAVESSGGAGMQFADMNGDGFPDLVWYAATKPLNTLDPQYGSVSPSVRGWWVMYSTGGAPDENGAFFRNPTRLTDPSRSPASIWETAELFPVGSGEPFFRGASISNSADVNGDGRADWMVHETVNGEPWSLTGIALGATPVGDLLHTVTNGLGSVTSVAYKAAKDDRIYTPGAPVAYPIRELRASTPVVSDVWKDGGTDNDADRAHFSYQYSGNRMDLSGRGGLGFHSFVTLDRQTNVFKYQFLAQSFPMTGLTHRDETYRYLGPNSFNIISTHDNTIVFDKVAASGGASIWPFISKAVESRWEDGVGHLGPTRTGVTSSPDANAENLFKQPKPSGAHITITAESLFDNQTTAQTELPGSSGYYASDVDGANNLVGGSADPGALNALLAAFNGASYGKITHGNLTQLKTSFGDGYSETVKTEYQPVTANGLSGRVDSVTTSATSPGFGTETAPIKSFTYWTKGSTPTPLVETETIDAADNRLDLTTAYERDDRGRVEKTSVKGRDLLSLENPNTEILISQVSAFDDRFDLPTAQNNAYDHETATVYHPFLGKPTSVTDMNGGEVTTRYDALGRITEVKDVPKNLRTHTEYAWDSSVTISPPAGVTGISVTSAFRTYVAATAKPAMTTYCDRLGRIIRTVKENFSGNTIVDTVYNKLGQVVAVSNPYSHGGTKYWTKTVYDELGRVTRITAPNGTVTTHDYQGRATRVSVDAANLDGVNPPAQVNTTLVDAKGRTLKIWNADNVPGFTDMLGTTSTIPSIAFDLDGFGRMRKTTLKGQELAIAAKYDELGRQTELRDPDKGLWKYKNSALGYVLRQEDTRENITKTTYDVLGRPLIRTTEEASGGPVETTKWYYWDSSDDPATQRVAFTTKGWIGALQRVESTTTRAVGYANLPAFSKSTNAYYYDTKGRVEREVSQIGDRWFATQNSYDDYSRLAGVRHYWRPAGLEAANQSPYLWEDFGYTYHYDSRSYLLRIDDTLSTPRTWWEADANDGYDYLDRPVLVRKGSGHWTHRSYRDTDGVLTAIVTGPTAGSASIQNLTFGYDGLGNLVRRAGSGGNETYGYDELNRLRTRNGITIAGYEPNGNIASKTDVGGASSGTYDYDPENKPHAVRKAFGYEMGYDANGNLNSRTGNGETWAFRYAGFDKPRWMARDTSGDDFTEGVVGSEFLYNGNRSRTVQLEFDQMSGGVPSRYVRKRIYGLGSTLEANYEAETPGPSPVWKRTKVRIYVPGPEGVIGAREFDTTQPSGGTENALVYHYDHLGSIESITPFGATSAILADDPEGKPGRFSADAWGQRRNPFTLSGPPSKTGASRSDDGGADGLTPRGFTSHEMLDDLGLVHMNGRIYDPLLGRFLSADILVSNPGDLQNYNRFTYCGNNPTSTTDPSGFESEAQKEERRKAAEKWAFGTRTLYVSPGSAAEGSSTVAANQAQAAPTPNSHLQGATPKSGGRVNPLRRGSYKNGDRWLTDVPFDDSSAPNSESKALINGGLAAHGDGMYTDGSVPWLHSGGEAAASGKGGRLLRLPKVQTGPTWLRPANHEYVVGRDGHLLVWSGKQGPGVGSFIDDNIPGGHTFGTIHDALVNYATERLGIPDSVINIPTMRLAYTIAVLRESANTAAGAVNAFLSPVNQFEVPFPHEH